MVLRGLWRIIVVAFAFLIAAGVTLLVLTTIGLEQLTQVWRGQGPLADNLDGALVVLHGGFRLVSAATIVPALLVVAIGEIGRIRQPLFYVLGGGAALAAIPLIARLSDTGAAAMPALLVLEIFATAGFAGGGVYWLIAGRRA
jgi:hypothetical protein